MAIDPAWWGKRGVCIIGGVIYGAGEVIPEAIFLPTKHPFGQTQNQPALPPPENTHSGGRELEETDPEAPYVSVCMRYQDWPAEGQPEEEWPLYGYAFRFEAKNIIDQEMAETLKCESTEYEEQFSYTKVSNVGVLVVNEQTGELL